MRISLSLFGGGIGSCLRGASVNRISTTTPILNAFRSYSNAAPAAKPSGLPIENRNTAKHILSRKTFLVDYYKYLNDNNEILLYVHHNNIPKNDNLKIRSDLKKIGAKLCMIRNNLYEVYLRSEKEADPADKLTSIKNKKVKHPLAPLLTGPTAVITIPECDPKVVEQVLKILKFAQERLFLVGAKVESKVFDIDDVNAFKSLPNKSELQGQLAGLLSVLGGAGLVRTLEASGNVLYLTMEERRKDLDPNENKDD